MRKEPISVLIVDDSALIRQTLYEILVGYPDIRLLKPAADPYIAARRIKEEIPEVIFLDIEMPKMDGITFLKRIMSQHPIPVIILSTLTAKGSITALQALEAGAIEVLEKPKVGTAENLQAAADLLYEKVCMAASVKIKRKVVAPISIIPDKSFSTLSADPSLPQSHKIIAIGASTGGTEAIRSLLKNLPNDMPGIVIVQHMPVEFTGQFAQRLNEVCPMYVKLAEDGEVVKNGVVYIAPGDQHLQVVKLGNQFKTVLLDTDLVNRHKPSVEVLMNTVAEQAKDQAVGVMLTGMGADGSKGMKRMFDMGAYTIAQNEESCVVFGMPKEAIKLGGVEEILPLEEISKRLMEIFNH